MAAKEFGTFGDDVLITGTAERPATYDGEPDAADTLCYYRFASNQSWLDQVAAINLTPQDNAAIVADGALFDGNADYASGTLALKGQAYTAVTIECWFKFANLPAVDKVLFDAGYNMYCYWRRTAGPIYTIYGIIEAAGGRLTMSYVFTPDVGTWYHVALVWVRDGTCRLFFDGAQQDSDVSTDTDLSLADNDWAVGDRRDGDAGRSFDGTIDQVRVTKVAEYTAAFTPVRTVAVGGRIEVPSDLTLASGKTLTLDDVSTVDIADGKSLTATEGTLAISGRRPHFTSTAGSAAAVFIGNQVLERCRFSNFSGGVELNHADATLRNCLIFDSTLGVNCSAGASGEEVSNCTFKNCPTGVNAAGGDGVIKNCAFEDCATPISAAGGDDTNNETSPDLDAALRPLKGGNCDGRGLDTVAAGSLDLDGKTRKSLGLDIGCYEFQHVTAARERGSDGIRPYSAGRRFADRRS